MITFLGMLTMQVGILVLATSFITISICSIMTNITCNDFETIVPWTISLVFCILLIITWVIAYDGAYNEVDRKLRIALKMLTIIFGTWIILCMCALLSNTSKYVCIANRCPTTMWFMPQSGSHVSIQINMRPSSNDTNAFALEADDVFSEDEMKKDDIKQTRLGCEPQNIPLMDFKSIQISVYESMIMFIRSFVWLMFAGLFIYSLMVLKNYEECVCLKNTTSGGYATGSSAGQMQLHC